MNSDQKLEVGRRLQEIRGSRDQRTFAEAVDSVQQTISKYERGEVPRSWLFLARLAEEEDVDLNFLLTGDTEAEGGPSEGPTSGRPGEGNGNGRSRASSGEEPRARPAYAGG